MTKTEETEETEPQPRSKLGETADHLEAWAANIDVSDDACVKELLGALRSDENLNGWAEIDLDRGLPIASEGPTPSADVRDLLSVFRNVLVFVPIVLAWLGIRSASNGYRKAIARSEPDTALDFLSYWTAPQRGFDRLQNVALMIAVVVCIVIVATVALALLDKSANRTRTHRQQETERQRAHLVISLRLVLASRRKVDFQNVEASLTTAIDDFKYSSNHLRESTTQLSEIFLSSKSLGPQLERSTEKMNEIVTLMQRDLTGSITSLTGQIRDLGSELTGIDSKLGRSIDDFKYSSNHLRESTTQLSEIFLSTEALGPQLERSTEKMKEIVTLMQRDLTGSITSLTGQIRSLGDELTNIDSKLGRSLDERIERVVKMTSGVVQNLDFLGQRLNQICLAAEASAIRIVALTGTDQHGARAND